MSTAQIARKVWWGQYIDTLPSSFIRLLELESQAETIETVNYAIVPPLVQTEKYAQALTQSCRHHHGTDRRQLYVDARMQRQHNLLGGSKDIQIRYTVDEGVLRRMFTAKQPHIEQLEHMHRLSTHPRVSLRVMPFENGILEHNARPNMIHLIKGSDSTAAPYEQHGTMQPIGFVEDAFLIEFISLDFAYIRSRALSESDSRSLITDIIAEIRQSAQRQR